MHEYDLSVLIKNLFCSVQENERVCMPYLSCPKYIIFNPSVTYNLFSLVFTDIGVLIKPGSSVISPCFIAVNLKGKHVLFNQARNMKIEKENAVNILSQQVTDLFALDRYQMWHICIMLSDLIYKGGPIGDIFNMSYFNHKTIDMLIII